MGHVINRQHVTMICYGACVGTCTCDYDMLWGMCGNMCDYDMLWGMRGNMCDYDMLWSMCGNMCDYECYGACV